MPKIKDKKKKKQIGGDINFLFLSLADTFHDFWNCKRGKFKQERLWQYLLNYKLVQILQRFLPSPPEPPPPAVAYSIVYGNGGRYNIKETPDVSILGNDIFQANSENIVRISDIEDTTYNYMDIGIIRESEPRRGRQPLPYMTPAMRLAYLIERARHLGILGPDNNINRGELRRIQREVNRRNRRDRRRNTRRPGFFGGMRLLRSTVRRAPVRQLSINCTDAPNLPNPDGTINPYPKVCKISGKGEYENPEVFENICRDILEIGDDIPFPRVYIICDAGASIFGKLAGTKDDINPNLNLIITPQTIGDSAPTSLTPEYVNAANILYRFPKNNGDDFESNSNSFTTRPDYTLFYSGNITSADNYDFSYNVKHQIGAGAATVFTGRYTPVITIGPSAGQLGAVYLYKILNAAETTIPKTKLINDAGIPEEVQSTQKNVYTRINTLLQAGELRANTELNVWASFRDIQNPEVFIDMKRGGDRDQIMSAYYLTQQGNPNIIFVTGDRLCAVQAVKLGLPTILYGNKLRTIRYWKRNAYSTVPQAAAWRGGSLNTKSINTNSINTNSSVNSMSYDSMDEDDYEDDEDDEEMRLKYEPVNINDFVSDISSKVAASINSFISKKSEEIHKLVLLYRIVTDIESLSKIKSTNTLTFYNLNNSIINYNSIVNNKISEVNNIEAVEKLLKTVNDLIATIKQTSINKQQIIDELMVYNFSGISSDLLKYIELKYFRTKENFLVTSDSIKVYDNILSLLTDKTSDLVKLSILNYLLIEKFNIKMTPTSYLFNINDIIKLTTTEQNKYNLMINKINQMPNIIQSTSQSTQQSKRQNKLQTRKNNSKNFRKSVKNNRLINTNMGSVSEGVF
jgi:hypothetical protein